MNKFEIDDIVVYRWRHYNAVGKIVSSSYQGLNFVIKIINSKNSFLSDGALYTMDRKVLSKPNKPEYLKMV